MRNKNNRWCVTIQVAVVVTIIITATMMMIMMMMMMMITMLTRGGGDDDVPFLVAPSFVLHYGLRYWSFALTYLFDWYQLVTACDVALNWSHLTFLPGQLLKWEWHWDVTLYRKTQQRLIGNAGSLISGIHQRGTCPERNFHDDVIKWKHFPRYWSFVRGIHRSPVKSPHKG